MGDEGGDIAIESIVVFPVFILIGGYCLYAFFKKEKILVLKYRGNKTKKFSMSKFEKSGQLKLMLNFISSHTSLHREI